MEISREFRFEAAHRLPRVPEGHKCARPHGHSYRGQVTVAGCGHPATGWGCDLAEITAAFAPLLARLDHYYLNDIEGLDNPTSENLARWVWERLSLPGLARVTVRETCASACVYEGPVPA